MLIRENFKKTEFAEKFDNLSTDEIHTLEREMCKTSLKFLCKFVLNMQDWDKCHDDLESFLSNSQKNKKLVLIPREHLKTSIVTVGKSIQYLLNNPNLSILFANAVQGNAESFLFEVKEYMTTKSYLPALFGKFESERWNTTEIRINQRVVADKSPTIAVAGADSAITSQHYDIIFLDDIINDQTVNTPEQIEKSLRFYRNILDLLKKPNGILYVVGTRWDEKDLYGTIKEEFAEDFDVYEMGATKNREMDGEIIFPNKFSRKVLDELLRQKGSYSFNAQYMNLVTPKISRHFKPPIRYWNELPDSGVWYDLTVDLAISENDSADYTVISRCAKNKEGQMYVAELVRGHFNPSETIDKIFEQVLKCPTRNVRVGIESVAYQKALVHFVEQEQKKRAIHFEVIPIVSHRDKFTRILTTLQPIWEQGNILLKQGMVEAEQEFAEFPRGKHDDILDALSMQTMMSGAEIVTKKPKTFIPEVFRDVKHDRYAYA